MFITTTMGSWGRPFVYFLDFLLSTSPSPTRATAAAPPTTAAPPTIAMPISPSERTRTQTQTLCDHFLLSAIPRPTILPIATAAAPPTTAMPTSPSEHKQHANATVSWWQKACHCHSISRCKKPGDVGRHWPQPYHKNIAGLNPRARKLFSLRCHN